MPNGVHVNCIAWNSTQAWIACGGEKGSLKVLLLEKMSKDGNNLSMNQTLQGHEGAVKAVCWNENHQKLTSSDKHGLIIVWILHKGMWFEEMINNRNKSFVRDMRWDGEGMRICIVYEDGAIIVGSVDGRRLWATEQKVKLAFVEWSPDGQRILACSAEGHCYVYDAFGVFCNEFQLFTSDHSVAGPLTCMVWHRTNRFCRDRAALAFGFQKGLVRLMRDETDREPILFHTEICILHMEWNLDGSVLAVAGFNSVGSDSRDINKVIFYDVHGNLLHVLRVPGKAINSIAWEGTGSRFAIAVDSFVYFADIRPNYRWGSLRDTIIYAFPMLGREEDCVMFWNYESLVRQAKFVKNLVGICTAGGHCVLVSQSTLVDQFLLVLCDSMGTIIQSTCVQVNPLFTAMTEQYMAIACQTCVYLWSFDDLGKSGMLLSRVHRAHGGESWKEDDLDPVGSIHLFFVVNPTLRSTDEHICALSISKQYILIGVQSGALECHQLPSLNNLAIKHKLASRPRHLSFNCDSTKIGVIDVYGLLTIFELDTKSSDHSHQVLNLIPINHRKDVRDMQWSDDDPDLYAVMEKNRVYIFRGGNPEEPIVSNGNICSFCDLRVKAILLDEVMKDPERPKKEHMIQFETKSLRDMRGLMHHDISFQESDVVNFAEANNHNCLWRLLSKSALDKHEYANAYLSFVHSGDYHGVELIKKLKMTKDDNMRQAAIITYFKKFDQAEDMYTLNNQHDHAINLRSNIGDWFKVEKLVRSNFAEDRRLEWICKKIGYYFYERQKFARAVPYFSRSKHIIKLAECLYLLENFTSLERVADRINEDCEASSALAHFFSTAGMCKQAVISYLHANNIESAILACIATNRWEHAKIVTGSHGFNQSMGMIGNLSSRVHAERSCLATCDLFRKANLQTALLQQLRQMLRESVALNNSPLLMKKVNVLLAIEAIKKEQIPTTEASSGKFAHAACNRTEGGYSNPDSSQMSANSFWRKAEAYHFWMLAQRQLYEGQFEYASRTSLILEEYEDVIEILVDAAGHL